MHKTTMTIGGEPICGTRTFGVINPATGNVFAEAPECSKSELDDAMDAAARAYCTWRADEEARREGLRRGAEAGMAAQGELAALLSGRAELGAWMTSHSAVRKISFTGSVATGKAIAAAAAPDLKRVTLELGGNDAAIVLDDADPAAIARDMFWGAFINCGQICAGIKRVYVPEALHDDLVEALAARARKVRVGEGTREGVQIGPINNRPQYERIKELVNDALAAGGRAVAGGKPMDGDGYFFEPTILTGVSDGVRIVDEEQFGPALPIIPYRDLDDAIERANATQYGLCGSVWSSDLDRAADVSRRLECGTAYINAHLAIAPHLPFGGTKWSGIGVENGHWGLDEFTNLQVLYRSRA